MEKLFRDFLLRSCSARAAAVIDITTSAIDGQGSQEDASKSSDKAGVELRHMKEVACQFN